MEHIIKIFEEIKNESSLIVKKEVIGKYSENELFKKCIKFLVNKNVVTGLNTAKINKIIPHGNGMANAGEKTELKTFGEVIDYLLIHNTGRDVDICNIVAFVNQQPEQYRQWYRDVITRTYKLGADTKLINSAIPELIPEFNVQLGTSIEKANLKPDEYIFISQKLNGVRMMCLGSTIGMSRSGKEYKGIEHILNDLKTLDLDGYAIDGELIYKNNENLSDSEAFQKGTGIADSKSKSKTELKFVVFDVLPLTEFDEGISKNKYSERKKVLIQLRDKIKELKIKNIEIVRMVYEGKDHNQIWHWLDYAENNDWEGVIINLDVPYECKRTKKLIKVKKFYDIALMCTAINIAEKGKYKGKVGSISCKYYDDIVDVGSGFNDEDRIKFFKNPELIVGKIISIKYKELTKNKNGTNSLQFPVYQGIVHDKDEPDDEEF